MGTIANVSPATALNGPGAGRSLVKTRNGFQWVAYRDGDDDQTRVALSTDGGATWTDKLTFDGVTSMALDVCPGVDGRDWLVAAWVLDEGGGREVVRAKAYRLFNSVDPREVAHSTQVEAGGSDTRRHVAVAAGIPPGQQRVHATVRWSQDNGQNTHVWFSRVSWTRDTAYGGVGNSYRAHQRANTDGGTPSPGALAMLRTGFHPASQPDVLHLWSQDHDDADERRVYLQRHRASGAGLIRDPHVVQSSGAFAPVLDLAQNGEAWIAAWADESDADALRVEVIPAVGDQFNVDPPQLAQGAYTYLSVAADPDTHDFWVLAAGATGDQVHWIRYDWADDQWDASWTLASADVLANGLGSAAPITVGNVVDYAYMTGGSPAQVEHGTAAITNRAPYAPAWAVDPTVVGDRTASFDLRFDVSDPDGDTLERARVRRAEVTGVGAGSWEYWTGGGWQAAETDVALGVDSGNEATITLPAGWASFDGQRHVYQAAVRDADTWSAWSPSRYLTGSTPPVVAITAPADGATIEARSWQVTWTGSTENGVQIRLRDADLNVIAWDTRHDDADDGVAGVTIAPTGVDNNATYVLELFGYNADGLPSAGDTHTISLRWTPPPSPSVTVDVFQALDSEGRTVDAGLRATWVTPTPVGLQPDPVDVALYRIPAAGYVAGVTELAEMIRVAGGLALDGALDDYGVPGGTLVAYVAVTRAADGTEGRSDLLVANLLTRPQSDIEDANAAVQFTADADTTAVRDTTNPIEGSASLLLTADQATDHVGVTTLPVRAEYGPDHTIVVDVVDVGDLVDVRLTARYRDEDGNILSEVASTWQPQTPIDPPPAEYSYAIQLSTSPDRSNPVPADGGQVADTGNYLWLDTDDPTLAEVRWFLDDVVEHVDSAAPWDFQGGSVNSAADWDVTAVTPGVYTVEARAADGTTVLASAQVTVAASQQAGDLAVVAASASHEEGPNDALAAVDGSAETRWSGLGIGVTWTGDLGNVFTVGSVEVVWLNHDTRVARFAIELSADGSTFTRVFDGESVLGASPDSYNFPDRQARYVRLVGFGNTENEWTSIVELTVFGFDQVPAPPTQPEVEPTPADGRVDVAYTRPLGPVTDTWEVQRATAGAGGPFTTLKSGLEVPAIYADTNVVNDTSYWYRSLGRNADGASPVSPVVAATPTAGPPPGSNVNLSRVHTQAELDFLQAGVAQGSGWQNWSIAGGVYGWQRIVSLANAALGDSYIYSGPSGNPVRRSTEHNPPKNFYMSGWQLLCLAIRAAVEDNDTWRGFVADRIITQASQSGLDWRNRSKYPIGEYRDGHPLFSQGYIWRCMYFALEWVGWHGLSPSDRAVFEDRILRGMGEVGYADNRNNFSDLMSGSFPNETPNQKTGCNDTPYDGGDCVRGYQYHFNNRRAEIISFFGMAGLHLGIQSWVDEAIKATKQHLQFSFHPDGWVGDFERGHSGTPDLGWQYAFVEWGWYWAFADLLARQGDLQLVDYVTNHGATHGSWDSTGGNKSLETLAVALCRYIQGAPDFYGRRRGGNLIDPDQIRPADVFAAKANVYYDNSYLADTYNRSGSRSSLPGTSQASQGRLTDGWSGGPGGAWGDSMIWRGAEGLNPYA